ncbi:zinc metalloprotease HtpX [Candidatus Kaiserbacteria bacterium CG10_big_fil_rev_8_21_14_0_10_49_17]|uniref:Protease HtpX homolog n=1 Tax=Candidatus Kaiserbacteria bacterium CG10_big_fil_rev_8_21_14_0_10_49_17 TaxID=1974609 RepID=A0A2M6WEQ5_9BACT|nr:MAG: zinc metalloprotease HtpX [Candidatus Kaiserbacteria bacterium CG10_big_fil_rev_8_21_14_0_10_49_17]
MATIYTHRDSNLRKTWFLMLGFFLLVIAVGWSISYYVGNISILVIAVIFALFMNVGAYWFSDSVVIKMTRAKPVTRDSHRELWNILENLSITAGLPMPKLYIINDPAPNAFATGRNPEHAAVVVTTGLLAMLERNELEGVIAHELSHIGNRDMLVMTVAVVLVGFVAIISDIFIRMSMFGGSRDRNGGAGWLAVLAIVAIILSPIAAKLIQFAISRKREYMADASGALLTRYPEGLAAALEKISSYQAPMKHASHATAHLFIANPFGGKAVKGLNALFSTHPPVEKRIAALRGQS